MQQPKRFIETSISDYGDPLHASAPVAALFVKNKAVIQHLTERLGRPTFTTLMHGNTEFHVEFSIYTLIIHNDGVHALHLDDQNSMHDYRIVVRGKDAAQFIERVGLRFRRATI